MINQGSTIIHPQQQQQQSSIQIDTHFQINQLLSAQKMMKNSTNLNNLKNLNNRRKNIINLVPAQKQQQQNWLSDSVNLEQKQSEKIIFQRPTPKKVVSPAKFQIQSQNFEDKKQYTLVLDLDNTLICYQHENNRIVERPFLREFLEFARKYFEIVIFTSAEQGYADMVIDQLNKIYENCIQKRFYRQHMVELKQNVKNNNNNGEDSEMRLVKKLKSIFEKEEFQPEKTVFIDDISENFCDSELKNCLKIKAFDVQQNEVSCSDFELQKVQQILEEIVSQNSMDVRNILKNYQNLEELTYQKKHKRQTNSLEIMGEIEFINKEIKENNFKIDSLAIQIETPNSDIAFSENATPENNTNNNLQQQKQENSGKKQILQQQQQNNNLSQKKMNNLTLSASMDFSLQKNISGLNLPSHHQIQKKEKQLNKWKQKISLMQVQEENINNNNSKIAEFF